MNINNTIALMLKQEKRFLKTHKDNLHNAIHNGYSAECIRTKEDEILVCETRIDLLEELLECE